MGAAADRARTPHRPPGAVAEQGVTLSRHLIAGRLTAAQAVEQDVVTILKGNLKLLERFTELFRIDT